VAETRPATSADKNGRRPGDSLIRAGQIAGAITALVTAGLVIYTQLKPGPPPAVLSANVKINEVQPGMTYEDRLKSLGELEQKEAKLRAANDDPEEIKEVLKTPGIFAEYTIETKGSPGQHLSLTRALYNARTKAPVPEQGQGEVPGTYVTPAGTAKTKQSTWIEQPASGGRYYLEVVLNNKKETLETAKSPPFQVPRT